MTPVTPPISFDNAGKSGESDSLRRLLPVSRVFGFDRGKPIDRYFIENFLHKHRADIQGRVLEIGDADYTIRYGEDRVTQSDVLHAVDGNPQATIIGDLSTGQGIPEKAFNCMILTQTFPFIFDLVSAVKNVRGALKPGGVLLATFCGISQISRYDMDRWGDFWRFTDASVQQLLGGAFGNQNVTVTTHGNVWLACAFLHGHALHEMTQEELDFVDPDYQLSITARAVRTEGGA